jgi:hypothetical protein
MSKVWKTKPVHVKQLFDYFYNVVLQFGKTTASELYPFSNLALYTPCNILTSNYIDR